MIQTNCPQQYYAKHEVHEAAQAVGRAPEAAVSALGTAGEIVAGVAGHVVDKVSCLTTSWGCPSNTFVESLKYMLDWAGVGGLICVRCLQHW